MRFTILLFFLGISYTSAWSQTVTVVSWSEFESYLTEESDKVRVVNFWATWCGPCVKELPYFQEAHEALSEEGVEIVLVSLDDAGVVDSKVVPFVNRKGITASVMLLDETNYNMFIPKVDDRWSGAIPMTLILDNDSDRRTFLEQELSKEELFEEIDNILN